MFDSAFLLNSPSSVFSPRSSIHAWCSCLIDWKIAQMSSSNVFRNPFLSSYWHFTYFTLLALTPSPYYIFIYDDAISDSSTYRHLFYDHHRSSSNKKNLGNNHLLKRCTHDIRLRRRLRHLPGNLIYLFAVELCGERKSTVLKLIFDYGTSRVLNCFPYG